MTWHSFRGRRREQFALLHYWDDAVRRRPATPAPPPDVDKDLASLVRTLHSSATPAPERPAYADDLLRTLLATYKETPTVNATALAEPHAVPDVTPRPGGTSHHPPRRRERPRRNLIPALEIALVIALILGSLGAFWVSTHDNRQALAPGDATPTAESTPVHSPDVPMYRGNPERTGVMPGPGIEGDPVELWRVELGGPINSAPAVVDGVLYIGAGDGNLHAIDAATGATIWTFTAASPISSSPAVVDGLVYVGGEDGTLYTLNAADGSEAWTFPGTRSSASVVVDAGVVYTGSDDGFLYAIDAATGTQRWSSALGESASRSPAIAGGIVYMGSADGVLHAVDSVTGEERWTFQADGGGLMATTAIANGVVYQGVFDGDANAAYALDAVTGDVLWRFQPEEPARFLPPAVGIGLVYFPGDTIYALDATTGEVAWSFVPPKYVSAAPALVGDTLYFGGRDQRLYAFDAVTGAEQWELALDGEIDFGPVVTGGVAYIGTTFGNLYAIGGAGTATLAALTDGTPPSATASPAATPEVAGDLATFLWGTTGGDTPLSQPTGIELAPDGTIWVTNGVYNQFEIFSSDGAWLESWGVPGSGEGEFDFQTKDGDGFGGVAFAPDGSFYVVEAGNRRVQHFSANREFLHAWGGFGASDGKFIEPFDIAIDAEGNVLVNDMQRDDVQKFTPDGTFLLKFGGGGSEPGQLDWQGWMTIAPDGTIWVADPNHDRIQQWDGDGTFLQAIDTSETIDAPYSIGVDANGRMLVTDIAGARIVVLDTAGNLIGQWGERGDGNGQFLAPVYLRLAGDAIYIADIDAGTLQKFQLNPPLADESASTFAAFLWESNGGDTPFDQPGDPTIDPAGNIWVSNGRHNQFEIFAPGGTWIESWGTPGSGEGEFDFTFPRSRDESYGAIAFAPDGSFYVSDMGNQRIQHFDANRQFQFAWGEFGSDEEQFISPFDIELDSRGNVWVVDSMSNVVKKFTADGEFLLQFGGPGREPGQLDNVGNMAIAPDDTVWVVDGNNPRIQQWDNDGLLLATFDAEAVYGFWGIAIDDAGRVFVSDFEGGLISILDSDGAVIGEWGQIETGPGQLHYPDNLVFDDEGRAYVIDFLNLDYTAFRLVAFQVNPSLLEPAATPEAATPVA